MRLVLSSITSASSSWERRYTAHAAAEGLEAETPDLLVSTRQGLEARGNDSVFCPVNLADLNGYSQALNAARLASSGHKNAARRYLRAAGQPWSSLLTLEGMVA